MNKTEINEKLMKECMELAKQGIDLEELSKDLESIFNICEMIYDLGIKNYKFLMKEGDNKTETLEKDKPTIDKISINGKDIHKLEELGIYDVIEDIGSALNEIIDKLEKESK